MQMLGKPAIRRTLIDLDLGCDRLNKDKQADGKKPKHKRKQPCVTNTMQPCRDCFLHLALDK